MDATDGLSRVRASTLASVTTNSVRDRTTYWQNDSSTVFWRGEVSGIPKQLFQNERASSTIVAKASGALTSSAASLVRSSKAGSAGESSSDVACTAARRAGSRTRSTLTRLLVRAVVLGLLSLDRFERLAAGSVLQSAPDPGRAAASNSPRRYESKSGHGRITETAAPDAARFSVRSAPCAAHTMHPPPKYRTRPPSPERLARAANPATRSGCPRTARPYRKKTAPRASATVRVPGPESRMPPRATLQPAGAPLLRRQPDRRTLEKRIDPAQRRVGRRIFQKSPLPHRGRQFVFRITSPRRAPRRTPQSRCRPPCTPSPRWSSPSRSPARLKDPCGRRCFRACALCTVRVSGLHHTVASMFPMRYPARCTSARQWPSSSMESAFFQRSSLSGKRPPKSPNAAAPSNASAMACASTSASECPSAPLVRGISTPPSTNLRPSTNRCASNPWPTRISEAPPRVQHVFGARAIFGSVTLKFSVEPCTTRTATPMRSNNLRRQLRPRLAQRLLRARAACPPRSQTVASARPTAPRGPASTAPSGYARR